jgi:hypothetical protein
MIRGVIGAKVARVLLIEPLLGGRHAALVDASVK